MSERIFPKYPTATWQAKGKRAIAFAIETLRESGGNRLVPHERARRDGAKFDDTGAVPRQFQVASPFWTDAEDPGLNPETYYPKDLNALIDSFKVHEVGDLTLPTLGKIRCRAQSYERTETASERDAAALSFTFVEDNEDGVLTSSFVNPSARAVASRYGEAASFSLESLGCSSKDFGASLAQLASEIEGLANAPDEFMADLETKAGQIRSAGRRITEAFSDEDGGGLMLDPVAAVAHRKIAQLVDTSSRVVAEKLSSRPRLKIVRFNTTIGMPQVAAKYRQDLGTLLAANPKIGNAFAIPAGTPINVYES